MREVELWRRLTAHLGDGYARSWAEMTQLEALGSRTVLEALEAGVPAKDVWRAAWEALELPARER
ncbi:DUF3046 domain-containing protein [Nigerium massiliense]|uniref:DUF3046 domain-containing protein n=1 Tax=Nigerium massiliense TaxID=1522317 RepID=UPI000590EE16|nr:DUF3046 domain-containing protein [Nigerium massiliense]